MDNKLEALKKFINNDDITFEDNGDNEYETSEGETYLVLTDSEAEQQEDEELDSYLDDCILPELPENMRHYFDTEKWKSDAQMDGRGHILNHYDGTEEQETINGVDYFIYRTN